MSEPQTSIRLRNSQWERILDLAFIGAKVYERFVDVDPEQLAADLDAYESLKAYLINKGVIIDDVRPPGQAPVIVVNLNVAA